MRSSSAKPQAGTIRPRADAALHGQANPSPSIHGPKIRPLLTNSGHFGQSPRSERRRACCACKVSRSMVSPRGAHAAHSAFGCRALRAAHERG